MFKKLFIFIIISNAYFITMVDAATREVGNPTIKNVLLGISENDVGPSDANGLSAINSILIWVKDSLSFLLLIVSIGVFLFVGIRIATARGKPEEFKKAITQLIYAIIGIFIVGLAWGVVTLVSGLNL